MFSEELAILDKNTVEYMIDEMQEELDRRASVIAESARQLKEQEQRSAKALQEKDDEIKKLQEELEHLKNLQ